MSSRRSLLFVVLLALLLVGTTLALAISRWGEEAPGEPQIPSPTVVAQLTPLASPPPSPEPTATETPLPAPTLEGTTTPEHRPTLEITATPEPTPTP
ncbi:MAG: hypothetical protein ACE5II_05530 [Anaerolineae bacterium]